MLPIWHLAIECSSTGGSIALLRNSVLEAPPSLDQQTILSADRGSVQTLAPAIDGLLRKSQVTVNELKFISVTVGPGSFTGLRVGLATVKMLALAGRVSIAPVDTLAAIARRFALEQGQKLGRPVRLVTAINAYRKQLFTASWTIHGTNVTNMRPSAVVDLAQWRADPWGSDAPMSPPAIDAQSDSLPAATETWLSGSALEIYPFPSAETSGAERIYQTAQAGIWQPLAEQVGWLGWENYMQGRAVTAAALEPNYIRASAAEEKLRDL